MNPRAWAFPLGLLLAATLVTALIVSVQAWHRTHVPMVVRAGVPPVPALDGWPLLPAARVRAATLVAQQLHDAQAARLALRELAGLYHGNRRYAEARDVEIVLSRLEPAEARWCYYLSDTYRNLGDMGMARRYLERAVELAPNDRTFRLRLAEQLFKEGEPVAARREYAARLELVPGDPYARFGLARIALLEDDRAAARAALEALVRESPEFAPSHNLLAQLYEQDGAVERAEAARQRGTAAGRFREADDPWLFRLSAWSFEPERAGMPGVAELRRQELERALVICRAAIDAQPSQAAWYQALGGLHVALGLMPDPTRKVIDFGGDLHARMARGRQLYAGTCAPCHLAHGEGQPGIFPPLAKSDYIAADKARATAVPVTGLTGQIVVNGRSYMNTMFAQSHLSTPQVADVLTYVMNSWGNELGVVTGADVEAAVARTK